MGGDSRVSLESLLTPPWAVDVHVGGSLSVRLVMAGVGQHTVLHGWARAGNA